MDKKSVITLIVLIVLTISLTYYGIEWGGWIGAIATATVGILSGLINDEGKKVFKYEWIQVPFWIVFAILVLFVGNGLADRKEELDGDGSLLDTLISVVMPDNNKITDTNALYRNGEVIITWNGGNAEKYTILRKEEDGEYIELSDEIRINEYIDKDIEEGVVYNYGIIPWYRDSDNKLFESEDKESYSSVNIVTIEHAKVIKPTKITGVQADYTNGEMKITWDTCDAIRYKILRQTGCCSTWETLKHYWKGNEYIDKDVKENQIYYYKIVGQFVNDDMSVILGELSEEEWEIAADNIVVREPELVNGITAEYKDNKVIITWEDCSVVGYKVSRKVENGKIEAYYPITNKYEDSDLIKGKTHYYKIAEYVYDENGKLTSGPDSEWVQITIPEE